MFQKVVVVTSSFILNALYERRVNFLEYIKFYDTIYSVQAWSKSFRYLNEGKLVNSMPVSEIIPFTTGTSMLSG